MSIVDIVDKDDKDNNINALKLQKENALFNWTEDETSNFINPQNLEALIRLDNDQYNNHTLKFISAVSLN